MSDHTLRFALRASTAILLIVGQVVLSSPANAAPGDLDPTFGTGGKVTTDFAINGYSDDFANAAALQPDGAILVAGASYFAATGGGPGADLVLARYTRSGSLDPTFGSRGRVAMQAGGTRSSAESLLVQPDGKIVAGGLSLDDSAANPNSDFGIVRLDQHGSPDPTFGSDGAVSTDLFGAPDWVYAIALQSDGRILAAGGSMTSGRGAQFAVVRYLANGELDTSFGTGGHVMSGVGFAAFAIALQPDGMIIVAGAGGDDDFALARLLPDGALDASFGVNGEVHTDLGYSSAYAIAVQPDGKILAAGARTIGSTTGAAVVRYRADGSLDTSFGSGGVAVADFGNGSGVFRDIGLLPDGKIVAVGGAANGDFAVARFLPGGELDGSFGVGGKASTSFPDRGDQATSLVLQPDGMIVAVGSRLDRRGEDFALARFQGRTQEAPPLAPSISSFSPTSGPVGTWVTIGGSGLTGATSVRFGDAYQPSFTVDPSGTSIVAVVPTGATTGPITVTTPNGTVVSTSSFGVTSTPTEHVRNVTLRLSKHLRTNGRIVVYDGFASCVQGRNVRIQRSFEGDWRTIAHDVTDADGRYSYRVPDRTGWYRAVIRQVTLPTGDTCNAAISGTRHHTAR